MRWAELDLNQRRRSQRIYSPPPLTTRTPTHVVSRLLIVSQALGNAKVFFDKLLKCLWSMGNGEWGEGERGRGGDGEMGRWGIMKLFVVLPSQRVRKDIHLARYLFILLPIASYTSHCSPYPIPNS